MSKGALLATLVAMLMVTLVACGGEGEGAPSPTPFVTPAPTTTPTPPAATPTPTLTPLPTASPTPAVEGSPYSLIDLQKAWEAKGLRVALGGPSAGFSGLGAAALDVRLTQGSDSMDLSILVYRDHDAASEDWTLTPGQAPAPKEGRVLPEHVARWWNQNVVVVVRSRSGDISADALDAFLSLGT